MEICVDVIDHVIVQSLLQIVVEVELGAGVNDCLYLVKSKRISES